MNGLNILDAAKKEISSDNGNQIIGSSVHVIAKQGKSAKLQLWQLSDLSESNANLKLRNPSKDWNIHTVPDGDIYGGLCQKYILLFPNDTTPFE